MFEAIVNERNVLAADRATGRVLGGVGAYYHRAWVFPLYTPAGLTVLHEFPFDHPFHNGCFVGQLPVRLGAREGNFWFAPPRRGPNDEFVHVGRMDSPKLPSWDIHASGVRFHQALIWRDEEERPILEESRTVTFSCLADATRCEVVSRKLAAFGPLEFPQTKHGGIGARIEPRLLPALGGVVLADGNRRGLAEVAHEQDSAFVGYENRLPGGGAFGIYLHSSADGAPTPWFVRDYGLALYNPTWRRSVSVPAGEAWTVALTLVAYDGLLTEERAESWARSKMYAKEN